MDTSNNSEDLRWINFYERQGNGDIPYNTQSYFIDPPMEGCAQPIQLVTPSEQQIEMAKSELRRKLSKPKPKVRKIVKRKQVKRVKRKPQKGGKKRQSLKKRKPRRYKKKKF